jgi:GAF domain-containing protein
MVNMVVKIANLGILIMLLPIGGSIDSLVLYFCISFTKIKMAEDLHITTDVSKEEQYLSLIPQIKALVTGEEDQIANLANIAAALKEQFRWFWVGFYLVKDDELVLGPFQGPVACTRIKKGKGVCGTSWQQAEILVVPDVDEFPGHIACASASRSEIVLPIFKGNEIMGVLDVDSEYLSHFDEVDAKYLKEIVSFINV